PFTVTYSASNVASVNVLIDDTFVANTSGGSVALTAPSEPGPFTVTLVGIDASGASLGASDAVTLTAAQTPPPPSASCAFVIDNEWNDGFVAKIVITNGGTEPINGWQVGWAFTDGSSVNNLWNADLSGTNPYSANNLTWNAAIAPGESIEFGFSGAKGVPNTPAPIVPVTGTPCGAN
ncbi:MAG: cellulose binding domain-containing protein, partial [Myxococcota bacterium]